MNKNTCTLFFLRIILLLICSITFTQVSFGQKEANNWYFGLNAGLDFNSGVPVAVTGSAIYTSEGCATISDSTGSLLFYTDGIDVYNKNNVQMPNGFGLFGGTSSTQSAIIVREPGSSFLYYIFTVDQMGGPNGFCYSIVDMTQQSGLGDVVSKNNLLLSSVTEKLCAVRAAGNAGIWVMIHQWGTDAFYAYLVSSSGIAAPVISHSGSVHSLSQSGNTIGQMKFNPQGTKLALAVRYQQIYELFDFNNATGIVSNPLTISSFDLTYGIEFSPDGSKLYTSGYAVPGTLYQYDLNAGSAAAILASQVQITTQDLWGLQLAVDGKIYVATAYVNEVGVIDDPNQPGLACNFNFNGPTLGTGQCQLGLPGFMASYLMPQGILFSSPATQVCEKTCLDFFDQSTNNPTSWQWFFPGGSPDTSTLQNPSTICYSSSGYFDVTLITDGPGGPDTLLIPNYVHVFTAPPTPVITQHGDTLSSSSATTYQWQLTSVDIPGATDSVYVATSSGVYTVIVTDTNGCSNYNSIDLDITGVSENQVGLVFNISPNPASEYLSMQAQFPSAEKGSFAIYNILGEMIWSENFSGTRWSRQVDIRNLPAANYFIELKTGQDIVVKKWLKE